MCAVAVVSFVISPCWPQRGERASEREPSPAERAAMRACMDDERKIFSAARAMTPKAPGPPYYPYSLITGTRIGVHFTMRKETLTWGSDVRANISLLTHV